MEDIEQRRIDKLEEVREDIAKLTGEKFRNLENLHRMERMLNKEVELIEKASQAQLETHLVTCNYAFYKSIIKEIEEMENAKSVMKTFKRDDVSVTVDIVTRDPHVWIKVVNRPPKTILIEYRDGKRNGDVIAQLKQLLYVSRRFNHPEIRVLFKKGVLREMADKLSRHGINVIGERVEKEDDELRGKWNDELIERLAEEEDSDWEEDEESPRQAPSFQRHFRASDLPALNLDISAVMLLVSNMCEPGGANYRFKEEMINKHLECERHNPAKAEVLEKIKGHRLIMSELAFQRVSEIVRNVGGPNEKLRFAELLETIERIPDVESDEIGRVAKLSDIKGITPITKRVFSCAEMTNTTTVTANQKFLMHSRAKNVYFDVIEIPPRPLTEQKEEHAEPI